MEDVEKIGAIRELLVDYGEERDLCNRSSLHGLKRLARITSRYAVKIRESQLVPT